MDACKLASVEGVLGIFLRESSEDVAGLLGVVVAEGGHGEHHAGEGGEVVTLVGGEVKETDALFAAGGGSGEAEEPADRSELEAEHVVLDAAGEVGVVEGGVDGEGLLGVGAGFLAVVEGGESRFSIMRA